MALKNEKTNKSVEFESDEQHDAVTPTFALEGGYARIEKPLEKLLSYSQSDTSEGEQDKRESLGDTSPTTETSPATDGVANPSFESDATFGDTQVPKFSI